MTQTPDTENALIVPDGGQPRPGGMVTPSPGMPDAELTSLAKRLSQEYQERLDYFTSAKRRKEYPDCTPEEQYALAQQATTQERAEPIMQAPTNAVSWANIDDLYRYSPELFLRKWEQIRDEAQQELHLGLTASEACSPERTPWERAQFSALRQDFAQEWNPRGGIEWNLIDQMAQAYTMVLYWQKIMLRWMSLDGRFDKEDAWEKQTPRLSTFESVNRAADMIDKFQRMFLRTLRALQNMRRVPIVVQNAGQVNVGQQQVNVGPRLEEK